MGSDNRRRKDSGIPDGKGRPGYLRRPQVPLRVEHPGVHRLLTASEASSLGVDRKTLERLTCSGEIERVARGVYSLAGGLSDTFQTWAIVAKKNAKGRYLSAVCTFLPRADNGVARKSLDSLASEGKS